LKVLVACEFSGVVREAFRKRGHDAWSCDLLDTEIPSEYHWKGDVLNIINDYGWDLMIAHPPCTYLCVTGNKWFKPQYKDRFPDRDNQRKQAVEFFFKLANADIPRICIENPIGIISTAWRKPDQIIQPFQFGHSEPKKTCLWLKNLPLLKSTKIVEPDYHITKSGKRVPRWYYEPSYTKERQTMRERTFQGIADAMAWQWGNLKEQIIQVSLDYQMENRE
jgi:hypothetical protein